MKNFLTKKETERRKWGFGQSNGGKNLLTWRKIEEKNRGKKQMVDTREGRETGSHDSIDLKFFCI